MNNSRRRGRPPGQSRTRDAILVAARHRFSTEGYHASLRAIADDAGVDAALISYYFRSKRGLFGASMELPANPPDILAGALTGPVSDLPGRVLHRVISVWDDPEHGAALRGFAVSAVSDADAARLFRQMAEQEIGARLAARLGGANASYRAAIAASQIAGLVFARYVLRTEPLASMPADELIARLTPPLRAALGGVTSRPRPLKKIDQSAAQP